MQCVMLIYSIICERTESTARTASAGGVTCVILIDASKYC
jgi:hypothetical protein